MILSSECNKLNQYDQKSILMIMRKKELEEEIKNLNKEITQKKKLLNK